MACPIQSGAQLKGAPAHAAAERAAAAHGAGAAPHAADAACQAPACTERFKLALFRSVPATHARHLGAIETTRTVAAGAAGQTFQGMGVMPRTEAEQASGAVRCA